MAPTLQLEFFHIFKLGTVSNTREYKHYAVKKVVQNLNLNTHSKWIIFEEMNHSLVRTQNCRAPHQHQQTLKEGRNHNRLKLVGVGVRKNS